MAEGNILSCLFPTACARRIVVIWVHGQPVRGGRYHVSRLLRRRMGVVMTGLIRVPLDGGGWFLVHAYPVSVDPGLLLESGPVRAGKLGDRVSDGVTDAAQSLQTMLAPVVQMSRVVLDQLTSVAPQELKVEFGVELTAEAGAIVTKAGGGCHLTVTLTWGRAQADPGKMDPGDG